MKRVMLGRTGIEVSRLGIGTGTEHPSGCTAQSLMDRGELARLLLYALERKINLWDTAFTYGTYAHIREALRSVRRQDVVLVSKLTSTTEAEALRDFDQSLRDLGTDYLDVCLLHGLRTEREFRAKQGAMDTLLRIREQGKLRAVGMSSHGLSAMRYCLDLPEIDLVWARINMAGVNMDSQSLGLYDALASVPLLKRAAMMMHGRLRSGIRQMAQSKGLTPEGRKLVDKTLRALHSAGKGIVGMKLLGAGRLSDDAEAALEYARGLEFVDAHIVGMLSEVDIDHCVSVFGKGT
jgi:aryl-alcohol dehydrogenase-like predicted oxidoreductase